jgi:hypothetical protein
VGEVSPIDTSPINPFHFGIEGVCNLPSSSTLYPHSGIKEIIIINIETISF